LEDVREGLLRGLPEVSPKYLYDERGSALFDRITRLPEYYPTRCERAILNRRSPEMVARSGAQELVELGSGTASKTRALLYAMAGAGTLRRYVPFDIDASVIASCRGELAELFPGLEVEGVEGDFERELHRVPAGDRRLVSFLGGTLGNLHPGPRARFLGALRSSVSASDRLLLGVDLVKDPAVIEAAYNDSAGVTAEFNLNVLRVLNRRFGGTFEPASYEHVAFFDEERSRIEMRLRARRSQEVRIEALDLDLALAAGAEIRTEISTKFTPAGLEAELADAGFSLEDLFTDDERLFALAYARPA